MYNYSFKSRYFGKRTRASKYVRSERKVDQAILLNTLAIHEQRKVTRESSISLYGHQYIVPSAFIGRRIWVKIIGNKVIFEANGEVFWKTKLKSF